MQQYTNQLVIQPSSSLLHVPVSLDDETLDESIAEGLSFATEKLDELDALRRLFNNNDSAKYDELKARYERFQSQSFKTLSMTLIAFLQVVNHHSQNVNKTICTSKFTRFTNYNNRVIPQTREVRKYRADWKNHRITDAEYQEFLQNEIARWIKIKKTSV